MKATLLAPPLLMLVACASTSSDSPTSVTESRPLKLQRTSDCVFDSAISGFRAINDRYIALYASGRRKAYIAEISGACFDVKHQSTLATIDGDGNGQICGFGRDSIGYRAFGRVESCRIISLEALTDLRRYEVLGESPRTPRDRDDKDEKDEDHKE